MTDTTTATTRSVDGVELPAPGHWAFDPSHSSVEASVRHLGLSRVRGRFGAFTGAVDVAERPEDSSVQVSIEAASVDTREPARDEHLRSADFLDVAAHPTIDFRSTAVTGGGDRWQVAGDLTIRGTTRPVTLDVTFEGVENDPWGGSRAAFSGSTEIDREAFGLTWNQVLESGGLLVGKKVRIELEIEVVRAA
jgi:polyisoprenoid-binding protein YceI